MPLIERKLTLKQLAFADAYIELGNATQAYLRAYPNVKKETTAKANASRLLTNANVSNYIDERMKEIESYRIMKADEALQLLTSIARGEVMDSVVVSGGWGYEVIEKPPDLNQRKDAAKELLKRYPMNKHDELKEILLEQQIEKAKAEVKQLSNENESSTKTIIINDKEEMRRLMNERENS